MKRLLTALALIAFALYLVFLSPSIVFTCAAIAMGLLCYSELSGLMAAHGMLKPGVFGLLIGVCLVLFPDQSLIACTLLSAGALAYATRLSDLRQALPQVAGALFSGVYTFAPWHYCILLRAINVHLLLFALAVNWIGDTVAYYVGRKFGRHPLAPIVSPKKTWEGAAGSIIGSLVFGIIYLHYAAPSFRPWQVALYAIAGNIAGQLGDLAESAIKRGANVKDSGTWLPGHGGMLDRVDGSLFSLPVIYALVVITTL